MPELPEVEVIRQFLSPKLVGLSFTHLDILNPSSFSGQPRLFLGQKITALSRLGKQLSIHFGPKLSLLIHLKMTGQLIYQDQHSKTTLGHPLPRRSPKGESGHTRLIFTLSDGSTLFFNDMRKFGWVRLLKTRQLKKFQANLGPDLLSPKFTPSYFRRQLRSSSRPAKSLLHDQNRFAGIGNIYANDALFLAGIHPLAPGHSLSPLQT
ncbi:formamidopyrimidine-DNA glycosylase, partial [Patescibacteria group bacterium]|nr:formamidopyrimidine-DNA glycosylase [Patescibacteria group bacterium]